MRRWWPILALSLFAAACEQKLETQPRYGAYQHAPGIPDFGSARWQPEGTVDQAAAERDREKRTRPPLSPALVARGQERFGIYCAPCHGLGGDGNGIIVQRGMPAPPSYHLDRLRSAPDAHFLEVIERGYGAMYSYADRVAPRDRWAIVAYIRALQLSRNAPVADIPDGLRSRLDALP